MFNICKSIGTIRDGIVLSTFRTACIALALSLFAIPAGADVITSTIPGTDISLPATIGTFTYTLPSDITINVANLYSPEFSFPAAPDIFGLQFNFDGSGALAFFFSPGDTGFFLGNDVTYFAPLLSDGSMELSMFCFTGPCPETYTRNSGDWTLYIDFSTNSSSVPEPSTLLLALGGLAIATGRRRVSRAG